MASDPDRAALPYEPAQRVQAILEEVLAGLGLEGTIEVSEDDSEISASIDGDDLGLLIGKHGQTIDAVQLLCYQGAFGRETGRKRVMVDAAGYRIRRREILERKADRAAEEALRSDREVDMESMSAVERRVIHTYLKDRAGIETYSEGDEPNRFVVVAPLLAE